MCNLAVAKIGLTAAWSDMREHRDKNIHPKLTAVRMVRVDC